MIRDKKPNRITELKQLIHKEMQKKQTDMQLVREYISELEVLQGKKTPASEYLEYSPNPSQPM